MCRRVTCSTCGKPTFAGCGAHIEQVLGDVPKDQRCQGHAKGAAPSTGGGSVADAFKKLLFSGVLLAVAAGATTVVAQDPVSDDAHAWVARGATLVDVRTVEEFGAGHLDGAVNIPVQDLSARLGELGAKDHPLVVYCRSGNRSNTAKGLLQAAGFTQVLDLGAMSRW